MKQCLGLRSAFDPHQQEIKVKSQTKLCKKKRERNALKVENAGSVWNLELTYLLIRCTGSFYAVFYERVLFLHTRAMLLNPATVLSLIISGVFQKHTRSQTGAGDPPAPNTPESTQGSGLVISGLGESGVLGGRGTCAVTDRGVTVQH